MGAGSSIPTAVSAPIAEPPVPTTQKMMMRADGRDMRHVPPRKVFYCHSCSAFSFGGQHSSRSVQNSETFVLTCPHPHCIPSPNRRLEEIPPSIEGSLRLQVIMIDLINARAAERSLTFNVGVPTVDVILGIDIAKRRTDLEGEQSLCSICNDDLECCSHGHNAVPTLSVSNTEEDNIMTLQCGHRFHESCIMTWFKANRTCPCCRKHVAKFKSIPSPDQLAASFDTEQLNRKIKFASRTKSFLECRDHEHSHSRMTALVPGTSSFKKPYRVLTQVELSHRLYGLLLKSNSGRGYA